MITKNLKSYMNIFALVFSIVLSQATVVHASPRSVAIEAEVSALLLSKEYGAILKEQKKLAEQSGRTLRITGMQSLQIGNETYAYVLLSTKLTADFQGPWTSAGSIAGRISVGPMGEIVTDSVFFKPAEEGPGGASVGNN